MKKTSINLYFQKQSLMRCFRQILLMIFCGFFIRIFFLISFMDVIIFQNKYQQMQRTNRQQIQGPCEPWFEDDQSDKQNIQKLICNKITHFATIDIIKKNHNFNSTIQKEGNKQVQHKDSVNFTNSLRKYKLGTSQLVYNRKSKINFIFQNKNIIRNSYIEKTNKTFSHKSYFQNDCIIQIGQQMKQNNPEIDCNEAFHPKLFQAHVFQTKYLSLQANDKNRNTQRAQSSCNQRSFHHSSPKRQKQKIVERRRLVHSSSQKNRESNLQHFQKILKLKQSIRLRNHHSFYVDHKPPTFFNNKNTKIPHSFSQKQKKEKQIQEKMSKIQVSVSSTGNDCKQKKFICFNRRRKPHSLAKQLMKTQEKKQIILFDQTLQNA